MFDKSKWFQLIPILKTVNSVYEAHSMCLIPKFLLVDGLRIISIS